MVLMYGSMFIDISAICKGLDNVIFIVIFLFKTYIVWFNLIFKRQQYLNHEISYLWTVNFLSDLIFFMTLHVGNIVPLDCLYLLIELIFTFTKFCFYFGQNDKLSHNNLFCHPVVWYISRIENPILFLFCFAFLPLYTLLKV